MNIDKILGFVDAAVKNDYHYDHNDLEEFSRQELVELFSLLLLRVECREIELRALVETLEERVLERTMELEEKNSRLEDFAVHDALTKLNNRRFFNEKLGEYSKLALRFNQPLGCVMGDIDHFKRFNDVYGHQAGDYVLAGVASLLKANVRSTDICARYGGEEFVILLPDTPSQLGIKLAEKLRNAVEGEVFSFNRQALRVTCSFGVAHGSDKSQLNEDLVRRADEALYRAKQEGRNCVRG